MSTLPCTTCHGIVRHDRACEHYDPAKQIVAAGGLCFPVVTDERMPLDTFVIQSPAAPSRVFMAPVGTELDEPGWTEVGYAALDSLRFDAATEWSIGSRGDVAPVLRSLDSLKPFTLDAVVARPTASRLRDVPDAAPIDVWDALTGRDMPGSRIPAHEAAMSALSAACHDAARRGAAHRAYERGEARRIAREIRATFHTSAWVRDRLADRYAYAVLDPAHFVRVTEV